MTCPCGKKSACASQQQPVNNNTDTDPCSVTTCSCGNCQCKAGECKC
ncbi:5988_t:CDS:2 [Funneliformis geosporum]|nr:5988_t:CDS:2 [Funneliformis geosporum]